MTRETRRDLEKAIADLEASESTDAVPPDGFDVTAEWVEYDGDAAPDADLSINYQIVMQRERAEREGREILGPADGPGDLVRVVGTDS
jgi:hypothetical protein